MPRSRRSRAIVLRYYDVIIETRHITMTSWTLKRKVTQLWSRLATLRVQFYCFDAQFMLLRLIKGTRKRKKYTHDVLHTRQSQFRALGQ